MSTDLALLDLSEAAERVARGSLSSVALTEACLARAKEWQASRNCFIRIDADVALEAARACDRDVKQGRRRGPLHGVPLAHKDMFYRAGKVSTGGSKILQDQVQTATATVLERLDAAGAIEIGVLNMAEFAAGPTGHNIHFGHCRNAFNAAHIPGGSSSGSAVAVAARAAFGALGSDTGASVRLPAAYNGVVGLKPTYGRVSRHGAMPRSWSMDHVGPFGRTARDVAILLQVIAGHDPSDATTSVQPVPDYLNVLGAARLSGLTIGIADHGVSLEPEIAAALDESVRVLERTGAKLVPIKLPDLGPLFRVGETIIKGEAAALHRQWLETRPQDYSNGVRFRIEGGLFLSAADYIDALRLRGVMTAKFLAEVLDGIDLLHLPASAYLPPTVEESDMETSSSETLLGLFSKLTQFMRPFNFLGLPAISVPCGLSSSGLPLAYQLVGHPFAEATLLRAADAYQRATDHHRVVPKL
ncbi:MAG TPA: amidase [Xanthobacteraceae bacterium]|nr:amidase [Xanthobacteraceae bacterium]